MGGCEANKKADTVYVEWFGATIDLSNIDRMFPMRGDGMRRTLDKTIDYYEKYEKNFAVLRVKCTGNWVQKLYEKEHREKHTDIEIFMNPNMYMEIPFEVIDILEGNGDLVQKGNEYKIEIPNFKIIPSDKIVYEGSSWGYLESKVRKISDLYNFNVSKISLECQSWLELLEKGIHVDVENITEHGCYDFKMYDSYHSEFGDFGFESEIFEKLQNAKVKNPCKYCNHCMFEHIVCCMVNEKEEYLISLADVKSKLSEKYSIVKESDNVRGTFKIGAYCFASKTNVMITQFINFLQKKVKEE
jgi:hypothetical protein